MTPIQVPIPSSGWHEDLYSNKAWGPCLWLVQLPAAFGLLLANGFGTEENLEPAGKFWAGGKGEDSNYKVGPATAPAGGSNHKGVGEVERMDQLWYGK